MLWYVVAGLVVVFLYLLKPKEFKSLYKPSDFAKVDFKRININEHLPPKTNATYAVIGTGFVGSTIISQLLARGEEHIKAIDVVPTTKFANNPSVQVIKANVLDPESLKTHLKGVDVVYATFAVIRYWQRLPHDYKISYDVNVKGTQNVIDACVECDVKYLIQTSTSYVAIGYDQSYIGMSEKSGYTKQPFNHYSTTKILAEKAVLEANNSKTKSGKHLLTASIRPCSAVYGYGDVLNSQHLMFKANLGFLTQQKLDYIYVENVALAHLLLEAKMRSNPQQVTGEAFCVSNGEAITREQWYSYWIAMHPKCNMKLLPTFVPPLLARISEAIQYIGKGKVKLGELELLTPPTIANCELSNAFNIEKAEKLLGYKPVYSNVEGIQKTIYCYLTMNN